MKKRVFKEKFSMFDDFRKSYVRQDENGEVIDTGSSPVNIDCDDGSYDTREYEYRYKTIDDYENYNHYYFNKETK